MHEKAGNEERVRASIEKMVTKYAERSLYSLNPDEVVVENIVAGLVRNKMKYGYAYCPCREVKGIPREDRKNICPCRTHKEEIARQGTCECALFVSEDYLQMKKKDRTRR